jgi:hypothetical protein
MNDAPVEVVVVTVAGRPVRLDPAEMKYNENTLSDYMSREYGWFDYFGKQLEYAQKEVLLSEIDAEAIQAAKFVESKNDGNTDSFSKAFSISHPDVIVARKLVVDRKEVVGHIKAHLKAWSENHENVQNRGHTLRKELDKLNRDIYKEPEESTGTADDFMAQLNK